MSFVGILSAKGFPAVVAAALCPEPFETEAEYVCAGHVTVAHMTAEHNARSEAPVRTTQTSDLWERLLREPD